MFMVLLVLQKNEDVNDVIDHEIIQVFIIKIVYYVLEYGMCICKVEGHHNILKMAIKCAKCYFPFITFFNMHQIIHSTSHINFNIHFNMTQLI
jgi:hypothetical protein